eukprot:165004-Pelagomonas_calceolata.AAC.1
MNHHRAGIIRRSTWISSARPLPGSRPSSCTIMRTLSEPVLFRERGMAGLGTKTCKLLLGYQTQNLFPIIIAHCTAPSPKLKSPDQKFLHAELQGGGCAGWAMLAIFCPAIKQRKLRTLCTWPPLPPSYCSAA